MQLPVTYRALVLRGSAAHVVWSCKTLTLLWKYAVHSSSPQGKPLKQLKSDGYTEQERVLHKVGALRPTVTPGGRQASRQRVSQSDMSSKINEL